MKPSLCSVAVLLYLVCWSQSTESYIIKSGMNILEIVPSGAIYRYPVFTPGTVVFRDGVAISGNLNYNMLSDEMQFVDAKGDTMALANEETIRQIFIKSDTFLFDDGYLRLVSGHSSLKLAEKTIFKQYIQKAGAYGLSSATTSTNNLASILAKRSVDLSVDQELVLVKHTTYSLSDRRGRFQDMDKKNILRMFPRQKDVIENYFRDNEVLFNRPDDVQKLVFFLRQL
jgi:hypothetical protein